MELNVPPEVMKRFEETLQDPDWQAMYKAWVNSTDTRAIVTMLKEVFCRPQPLTGFDNNQALAAQKFQEGCWAVIDALRQLQLPTVEEVEPEIDYGEDTGKGKRKGKKS